MSKRWNCGLRVVPACPSDQRAGRDGGLLNSKFAIRNSQSLISQRGFTLLELAMTIGLLGALAVPVGGLVVEHLRASVQTDGTLSAENLARYEHERLIWWSYLNVIDWCSVPKSDPNLPASETFCPAVVTPPNPYAGLPYIVTRDVENQLASDGSAGMKRITVKVFRVGETKPMITVITYLADQVSFPG